MMTCKKINNKKSFFSYCNIRVTKEGEIEDLVTDDLVNDEQSRYNITISYNNLFFSLFGQKKNVNKFDFHFKWQQR